MKSYTAFFNIILLAPLLVAGCATSDNPDKDITLLRMHLEARSFSGDGKSEPVPVFRENPVLVNIDLVPFADERDIDDAQVIEWMGGPAIRLKFNRHGTWMLENLTRRDTQRHIAINCTFGNESRWVAAPIIGRPIADGVLTFTPDATREETERIVRGLNNTIAKIKKKNK